MLKCALGLNRRREEYLAIGNKMKRQSSWDSSQCELICFDNENRWRMRMEMNTWVASIFHIWLLDSLITWKILSLLLWKHLGYLWKILSLYPSQSLGDEYFGCDKMIYCFLGKGPIYSSHLDTIPKFLQPFGIRELQHQWQAEGLAGAGRSSEKLFISCLSLLL